MRLDEAKEILSENGFLIEAIVAFPDNKVQEIITALTNNGWKFLKRQSNLKLIKLIKLVFISRKTHRFLVVQNGHRKNKWSFWIKEDGDTLDEWDYWDISLENVSIEKIKSIYPDY